MVSREALIKYGTLALILFFIIEAFFPLLYAPDDTVASTPTPSAALAAFQGSGITFANVTRLENVGFVVCDPSRNATGFLSKVDGVKQAFFSATGVLALELSPNASMARLMREVDLRCGSPLYRSALLSVQDVTLTDGNQSQRFTSGQFAQLATQENLAGVRGFVIPTTLQGARIQVSVSGDVSGNSLNAILVQETPSSIFSDSFPVNDSVAKEADAVRVSDDVNASGNGTNDSLLGPVDESILDSNQTGSLNGSASPSLNNTVSNDSAVSNVSSSSR